MLYGIRMKNFTKFKFKLAAKRNLEQSSLRQEFAKTS